MKRLTKICVFLLLIFIFQFYILLAPSYSFSPTSSTIYSGIDVSSWQGYVDYSQVQSSGISIVYIKASEGSNIIDTYFNENYTNAKSAGLKVGFYHYLTATNIEEAVNQATFFANTISGKSPDCKLAMDFESFNSLNNYDINQIALTFLQTVKSLTKKDVIVYSDTYNATCTFNSTITNYNLWVAQYGVPEPSSNNNWNNWVGWQYTDQGEVSGISGYVDMDNFTDGIFLSDTSEISTSSQNTSESYTIITIPYGATLSELAIEYNTTIEKLVEINNIANPNLIYAGNTLIIPTSTVSSTNSATLYVVKSGDTLSQIALTYNTTVSSLAYANNISNINLIFIGQILTIPTTSNYDMSHNLYTVKQGDTLWGISRKFGVSIAKIVMLNRISNPNLIYPGNVLRI